MKVSPEASSTMGKLRGACCSGTYLYSKCVKSNISAKRAARSRFVELRSDSEFKLFDTLTAFLKELFEKVNFEKRQQTTTKA